MLKEYPEKYVVSWWWSNGHSIPTSTGFETFETLEQSKKFLRLTGIGNKELVIIYGPDKFFMNVDSMKDVRE